MRRLGTWLTLVAGAVLTIGLAAQTSPNLSGMWRIPSTVPLTGDPPELDITQTPDILTIRTPNRPPETMTLRLDGQESRNQGAGPGAPTEMVSHAAWEAGKLVVTTTMTTSRGPFTSTQTFSLNGDQLVVETRNASPGGAGAPGGSRTATYMKYQPTALPAPPVRSVEAGFTSLLTARTSPAGRSAVPRPRSAPPTVRSSPWGSLARPARAPIFSTTVRSATTSSGIST